MHTWLVWCGAAWCGAAWCGAVVAVPAAAALPFALHGACCNASFRLQDFDWNEFKAIPMAMEDAPPGSPVKVVDDDYETPEKLDEVRLRVLGFECLGF